MSRNRALVLTFVATVLLTSAACGVLMSMQVSPTLIAVVFVAVGGTGSHLLSRIVMHYGVPEKQR
jgi:hypothetical protein